MFFTLETNAGYFSCTDSLLRSQWAGYYMVECVVAGWWATGAEVTNHSSVIHEYYSRECREPVHVTLDTSLQGARMGLRAYVCVALGVPRGKQGCMFTPIDVGLTCYEPEVLLSLL